MSEKVTEMLYNILKQTSGVDDDEKKEEVPADAALVDPSGKLLEKDLSKCHHLMVNQGASN